MVAFFFACYGAGTPQYDEFAVSAPAARGTQATGLEQLDRIEIAPYPFVARLPQRLLGHPRGGALAVAGHVDRAWGTSFLWEGAQQLATFESALAKLVAGDRMGFVMEDFNNRYAELSTEVASRIEAIKFREIVPPGELARLWTANNDARNYVIVGDPAVKLPVSTHAAPAVRPELAQITLTSAPAVNLVATAAATAAAATVSPATAADPRQSLREALAHLEQAVALLKAALHDDS